jgi:hypothetical protein
LKSRGSLLATALAVGLASLPARASGEEISLFRVGAGVFEFNLPKALAAELAVQYRVGHNTGALHPLAGVKVTADGAVFAYAGFGGDIPLRGRFVFRPSFAPGFYHQGNGKDLSAYLNFRTAVEIALRFDSGRRLGLEMDHVSNAGAAPTNLGEESLVITFALPVGKR